MRKTGWIIGLIAICAFSLAQCSDPASPQISDSDELYWRNWHDTVSYVGMEVCSSCHGDVRHTFVHTGMGSSFGKATPEKAFYDWDGTMVINDPHAGLSYRPYFMDDILMVEEFRLQGADTVHRRIQQVDYIIGSGQHTNSHIWSVGGYLFQAPFTYYTQQGRADLPPGYEDGQNSRFSRKIGLECMSCHNAMPTGFVVGSENKFDNVPLGIDCERCHGPGELHVKERLSGIVVDTSEGPDRSIVNPMRLDSQRQVEICQRCHLQGNAVLAEGKSFFDFKPGMILSDVMDVYLPRYDDSDESFIMASHVDRFKLSECVIQSEGSFTCISCHNPHISVRETNTDRFNATCSSCHGEGMERKLCSEDKAVRSDKNDNCVSCHMPVSGSEDIPHVTVHDHWIRIPEGDEENREVSEHRERQLQALVAINNANPSDRSKARAFLQQYEQFSGDRTLLDSAWVYIRKLPGETSVSERVHVYHLRQTPGLLVNDIERSGAQTVLNSLIHTSFNNRDAWTAYRIGEAYAAMEQVENARAFYARAVQLAPFVPEFENKFGSVSLKLGDIQSASASFTKIIEMNPYLPEGYGNMGYVRLLYGDTTEAISLFETSLELDPDYEPAMLNLISSYMARGRYAEARTLLKRLMDKYPDNLRYQNVWNELRTLD